MSKVKGKITTSDYLKIEDFNRLVEGLRKDKRYVWEAYCRLSFCTALRIGDVLKLKWRDILTNRVDIIEQKTQKTRTVKFNDNVIAKMKELHALMGSPALNSIVVCGERNPDKAMSREYINRQLKMFRVEYRLPIDRFSSHTFRKTFGRYVYESNNKSAESLLLLNTILKHSNLETTKRYIGLTQDNIDQVFESINF